MYGRLGVNEQNAVTRERLVMPTYAACISPSVIHMQPDQGPRQGKLNVPGPHMMSDMRDVPRQVYVPRPLTAILEHKMAGGAYGLALFVLEDGGNQRCCVSWYAVVRYFRTFAFGQELETGRWAAQRMVVDELDRRPESDISASEVRQSGISSAT